MANRRIANCKKYQIILTYHYFANLRSRDLPLDRPDPTVTRDQGGIPWGNSMTPNP